MEPMKAIEEAIRDRLHAAAGRALHDRVLAHVRQADAQSREPLPALNKPVIRRMIMKNSIVKLGIAAAIIAVLGIGIVEFVGTGSTSGVVWAQVVQKVEANRGFTFHETFRIVPPNKPEQVGYIAAYTAGSRLRHDWRLQPEGQLFRSQYYDFDAGTLVEANHSEKTYLRVAIDEKTLRSQQSGWLNPKDWVRQFMSSPYTKLGRQTIDGVLCEGIETTDPTFGDQNPPAANSIARLWVSVETQYPVRMDLDSTHATAGGDIQVEVLCDRFQWDVELSPDFFEPNIPSDYRQLPSSQ